MKYQETRKCPECTAILSFSSEENEMKCEMCGFVSTIANTYIQNLPSLRRFVSKHRRMAHSARTRADETTLTKFGGKNYG